MRRVGRKDIPSSDRVVANNVAKNELSVDCGIDRVIRPRNYPNSMH